MKIIGNRFGRGVLCAATALTVAGVGGAGLAAPASAGVAGIAVDTPAGYGSTDGSTNYDVYGAGCTYRLSIIVDNPAASHSDLRITASDGRRSVTLLDAKPTTSRVFATWRPTTTGRHTLSATLDGVTKTRSVRVYSGVQFPEFIRRGACFVLPFG